MLPTLKGRKCNEPIFVENFDKWLFIGLYSSLPGFFNPLPTD